MKPWLKNVLILLPGFAVPVGAATIASFSGDQVQNAISRASSATLNESVETLNTTSSPGYTGQNVYHAFQEEGTSLWGVANNGGAGLKLRWNNNAGVAGEASSGLFLFKKVDFLNGFNAETVIMNAANDTVSGTMGFMNAGGGPGNPAVAGSTVRVVIKDDAGYHISDATPIASNQGFSLEATERSYAAYNPFANTTTEAGTIGAASTPSFTDIEFVGFRLDATRGTDLTAGANIGLKDVMFEATKLSVTSPPSAHPNVLMIYVDDLRPQLNSYGATQMITPHMDSLAAGGYQFNRAYVQQAVCSPSRTSMMTGLRPDTTQVFDLTTKFRDTVPWVQTLPQHLSTHNYHSVGIGKIYHGSLNDALTWDEPWSAGSGIYSYATVSNQNIAATNGAGPAYENANVADNVYRDGAVADSAVAKLAALKNQQPFFYGVGFVRPHLPFTAPTAYWDLYQPGDLELPTRDIPADNAPGLAYTTWGELRSYYGIPATGPVSAAQEQMLIHGYYACVSYVDAQIGRVIAALDAEGLAENTIVVLWGDHGFHLGNHGQWTKHTNFERATRVPLMIHVPWLPGGVEIDALTEIVDLYPTVVDLCGLPQPSHLHGDSLKPLLENPLLPGDDHALSQYPRGGNMGYSMRTARYRYTEWRVKNSNVLVDREMYDYDLDPGEDTNVVDQVGYASVVSNLSAQLDARLQELSPFSNGSGEQSVLNGEFDDGLTNWSVNINAAATASFNVLPTDSGNGLGADPLLHMAITDGAASAYQIALEQVVPAQSAKLYAIRFRARAAANRSVKVFWRNKNNIGSEYYSSVIPIDTETRLYELNNIQLNNLTGTDPDGEIRFQVGGDDADVWIDSIEVVALTSFTAAVKAAGLTGADAFPDADPDNDLMSNLNEYMFNTDLTVSDYHVLTPGAGTSGLPFLGLDADSNPSEARLSIEYMRQRSAYDLDYQTGFTGDLVGSTWTDMGVTQNVAMVDQDWDRVEVLDSVSSSTAPQRFGRILVEFRP